MGIAVVYLLKQFIVHNQRKKKRVTKQLKFYVLALMIAVDLLQVVHYSIALPWKVRTQMSFIEILLRNLTAFLMIYYVFMKASKNLGKKQATKWLRAITIVFLCGIPINFTLLSKIEITQTEYEQEQDKAYFSSYDEVVFCEETSFCTSPYWITNASNDCIQILIFVWVVNLIDKSVQERIKAEKMMLQGKNIEDERFAK